MIRKLQVSLCFLLATIFIAQSQTPKRFDIVIHEIFADPTPSVGLPGSEFIELKNTATTAFSLLGCRISDGTSTAIITSNFILQPDSLVIICAASAASTYSSFGKTIGVSGFPSLNNDGDIITLYAPNGILLHAVAYTTSWYGNAIKEQGGFTLEMIDARNPCSGTDNWKASTDNSGGTPGRTNSVADHNPDDTSPILLRTYMTDSLTIVAVFNEPVDSARAATTTAYTIQPAIGHPAAVTPLPPLFNEVILRLHTPLQKNQVYELTTQNISDCSGNLTSSLNKARVGWPQQAAHFDIVINELLFNPPSGGYDYIELYNRSQKPIDLKQLYIANRNATGNITNIQSVSETSRLLFPDDYVALTENSLWLQQHFLVKDPSLLAALPTLPSMPDDKGAIVLTNLQGDVIDELQYDTKWHFALVDNEDGIALERINYNDSTQRADNWTSAASTANYGTPGYQNSQFRADVQVQALISVTPKVFSPDNNGFDDFAMLLYQVPEPGYMASITIFDAGGRPVRYLTRNAILGLKGQFKWDGLGDRSNALPVGIYIIFTEIFNLQGRSKKFKNIVTLARPY